MDINNLIKDTEELLSGLSKFPYTIRGTGHFIRHNTPVGSYEVLQKLSDLEKQLTDTYSYLCSLPKEPK